MRGGIWLLAARDLALAMAAAARIAALTTKMPLTTSKR
jgi:hypothetical protein